jgi:hypothetical protein
MKSIRVLVVPFIAFLLSSPGASLGTGITDSLLARISHRIRVACVEGIDQDARGDTPREDTGARRGAIVFRRSRRWLIGSARVVRRSPAIGAAHFHPG